MVQFPNQFDKEDLLKCARGELFGPGNPQLPEPPMLMMDRITEISDDLGSSKKGHVLAELDISPDLWFFKCHFPGDPVMPSLSNWFGNCTISEVLLRGFLKIIYLLAL